MTAVEVWERWKIDSNLRFKDVEGNVVAYVGGVVQIDSLGLPVDAGYFVENEWEPIVEWVKVSFMEAIRAFLYAGKSIKGVNTEIGSEICLKSGDTFMLYDDYKYYTWYVRFGG